MLSLIQALQTPSAEAYITSFPSQSSSVSPQSVLNVATFSNPVPDIIEKKLPVNIENRDIKDDKVPCEKKLVQNIFLHKFLFLVVDSIFGFFIYFCLF